MSPRRASAGLVLAALAGACERHEAAPASTTASARASSAPARATPPAPAPARSAPEPARMGESVTTSAYALSVQKVEECKVPRFFRARSGFIKLGVELEIRATGNEPLPVNAFYARLADASGSSHSPTLGGCEPALPAKRIEPGERVRGWITFEVPAKASGFVLGYSPYLVDASDAAVRVRLSR